VRRHATVDVFWGAGFLVVFAESLLASDIHHAHATAMRFLIVALVTLWSLQRSARLAMPQRGSSDNSRYVAIMTGAQGRHERLTTSSSRNNLGGR
jgi:steroid 5-alpha reductase family enzyme